MRNPGARALERQLGAAPPAAMTALGDEDLHDLANAIEVARHRQGAELAAAGDKAFGFVPRLLREPIRRVVR